MLVYPSPWECIPNVLVNKIMNNAAMWRPMLYSSAELSPPPPQSGFASLAAFGSLPVELSTTCLTNK